MVSVGDFWNELSQTVKSSVNSALFMNAIMKKSHLD